MQRAHWTDYFLTGDSNPFYTVYPPIEKSQTPQAIPLIRKLVSYIPTTDEGLVPIFKRGVGLLNRPTKQSLTIDEKSLFFRKSPLLEIIRPTFKVSKGFIKRSNWFEKITVST